MLGLRPKPYWGFHPQAPERAVPAATPSSSNEIYSLPSERKTNTNIIQFKSFREGAPGESPLSKGVPPVILSTLSRSVRKDCK